MASDKQIRVSEETRDDLRELGSMSDTYDDVISMLIEFYESNTETPNNDRTQW